MFMKNHQKAMALMVMLPFGMAAISCSSDMGTPTITDTSIDTAVTTPATTEPVSAVPSDLRFDGETFTIYSRDGYDEFDVGIEDSVTVLSDAVYTMHTGIEEQLGIELEVITKPGIGADSQNFLNTYKNSILAGDGLYDAIGGYGYYTTPLVSMNLFYNQLDLPYIDFSRAGWTENQVENTAINGKMYLSTGEFSYTLLSHAFCVLMNKTVAENNAVGDVYALVRDGKWTYDANLSLVKPLYRDLNGDTKVDEGDAFGLVKSKTLIDPYFNAFGETYTTVAGGDRREWNFLSEKASDIHDKVYTLLYNTQAVYVTDDETRDRMFMNDQTLFINAAMYTLPGLREMKNDYGILPYPKYDESQENYVTTVQDGLTVMGVSVNCKNPALAGAVLQRLTEIGHESVVPAYFDVTLKQKYSRDTETAEMLDIIRSSIQFDFALFYSNSLGDPMFLLANTYPSDTGYVSSMEKNTTVLDGKLTAFTDSFKE